MVEFQKDETVAFDLKYISGIILALVVMNETGEADDYAVNVHADDYAVDVVVCGKHGSPCPQQRYVEDSLQMMVLQVDATAASMVHM
jgi:hypothetical protein